MQKFALVTLGVAATMLAGCAGSLTTAPDALGATGQVALSLDTIDGYSVQYVGNDINAVRVSLMDADQANAVLSSNLLTGSELASHLKANKFSFTVENLKVNDGAHPQYHYNIKIEAYLEAGATNLIGSSLTAAPFVVTAGATTAVTMPALALIASPVGNAAATGTSAVTVVDNPAPAIVWK